MSKHTYSTIPSYEAQDLGRNEKRSPYALRIFLIISLLALVGFGIHATSTSKGVSSSQASTLSTDEDIDISVTSDEYGQPASLDVYGIAFVAEPFRTTSVVINNPLSEDSTFYFSLTDGDDVSGALGNDFSFSCETAGNILTLNVKEYDSEAANNENVESKVDTTTTKSYTAPMSALTPLRDTSFSIPCRYVRRELRSLTDTDLSIFMEAVRIMYTSNLEEGQEKYGPNFINYNSITLKHMSYNFGSGTCTPFHDGSVFYTGCLKICHPVIWMLTFT